MRWKDNIYFYISIFLLLFCFILIYFFYEQRFELADFLDIKTILTVFGTVFGAYFGARTAGKFAIKSVEKQIQHDRDNRRRQELDSILKTHLVFLVSYGTYTTKFQEILETFVKEKDDLSDDFFVKVDSFNYNAEITHKNLLLVRTELLPFEQYRTSLEVLKRIQLINSKFENTVPTFKTKNDKLGIDEVLRFLQEQLEELEVNYKRLRVFESEQKQEFKNLQ